MPSESEFRSHLEELKRLRMSVQAKEESFSEEKEIELVRIEEIPSTGKNTQPRSRSRSRSRSQPGPRLSLMAPANPLIDAQVTIVKPTTWIDCISRESRRVFVHDKWIVARIALPTIKQSGLQELLQ